LSEQQRKDYAAKLKAAGNKAYGSKDYTRAIDLYGQAILCKADAVFYSNRAACWNAMSNWSKVIDDTTAAITIDPEYIKALNRRANAYEQEARYSEALLDYTASCIIDQFRNDASAQAVERLLKNLRPRLSWKARTRSFPRLLSSQTTSNLSATTAFPKVLRRLLICLKAAVRLFCARVLRLSSSALVRATQRLPSLSRSLLRPVDWTRTRHLRTTCAVLSVT
jgi:tetratricopeptide (TPR) repeat protein